ncbi:MAG TPA: sulfatase [Candidatus Paceibacterota bacterium]|nr:sulfatase [Verrucomicrobiota bacterium]HOX02494.1 sulfatase [Verrucomicrobiota bacterium]HRZ45443.1 sulfatase [Candidatus Paceibacterota bacterium]HRZ92240.1 sulfatase [Candidatus Paceibacterota bacterium]
MCSLTDRFLRAVCLGLWLPLLGMAGERPNLILVTGDDMGFQLGCYGDTVATTPHMDRLAREGVRFTRGYVTQASCSPSRSSMLTGLYPHQNGQIGLAHLGYAMRPDVPALPTLLKKAGYRTGIIGKLHVAPESSFEFDYKQVNTADTRDMGKVRFKCNAFLAETGGQPFFLMLNFFDPHDPHLQDVAGSPKAKVLPEQAEVFPFMGTNSPALRQRVAEFTTCVNRVDEGVGVLLDVLRQRGLLTNTFLVVLGDNGPPMLRAKVTSFEAGVNVPFIAWWPGRVKPRVSDALVCSIDLMPTLLELAKAEPPQGLPGRSLLPLLRGQRITWRDVLATEYTTHEPRNLNPQRSIRDARYKLTVTLLKDPAFQWPNEIPLAEYRKVQRRAATGEFIELYDLESDPHEFKNLAGQPELKAQQERLLRALQDWRVRTQDPLLDFAALRALVLEEQDAPPTPVPAWKKAQQQKGKTPR